MKYSTLALSALVASTYARDVNTHARAHARDVHASRYAYRRAVYNPKLGRREVPQENSHKKFLITVQQSLQLDNPDGIVDPVFGLLGNAAAAEGQGTIADADCLQQATADQAFTNAKAAGDVDGMTDALIYRALERNTGSVGLASVPCTAIEAVNPEIAAIEQHQDPASENAAEVNFNIVINLAIQIASIGGDPTKALESGTFAPGEIGDPTAAGNTCNDPDDQEGCIFTEGLLVEDASVDDIMAAVASAGIAAADTAVAVDTAIAIATDAPPPALAIPSECLAFIPPGAAITAPPPPAKGEEGAAPPPPKHEKGVAPPPPKGEEGAPPPPEHTGVSPNPPPPEVSILPGAPPAELDCSADIASALLAAGFNADGSVNIDATATIDTAIGLVTDAPLANATDLFLNATATATATDVATLIVSPIPAVTEEPKKEDGKGDDKKDDKKDEKKDDDDDDKKDDDDDDVNINIEIDFGSCPNPSITFSTSLPDRAVGEAGFIPSDTGAFAHGSAVNIKVITDFICSQLQVECGANSVAIEVCVEAAQLAIEVDDGMGKGMGAGAAEMFNGMLGM